MKTRYLLAVLLSAIVLGGVSGDHSNPTYAAGQRRLCQFYDVTNRAGLSFRYDNDATSAHRFIETTGGGCAFIDYNNDGLLDIVAVQGGPTPGNSFRSRPKNVLYRNNGNGVFEDVTHAAGLDSDTGYAQGIAAADYDNDGWIDLLITGYGKITLLHNNHGRFEDVTQKAGLLEQGGAHWATSAAWIDYDRDGKLDLFVCHYASWFPDIDIPCFDGEQHRMYCMPTAFAGDHSSLYHNNGDGTFTDVSKKAGLNHLEGKALGVLCMDVDKDGWPDIFVTNDMAQNWLLRNQHDGTFKNIGVESGVAVGPSGQPLSGMGVAAGDFRGVGREDLFVVNFSNQPRSLFFNNGNSTFSWGSGWACVGDADQPFLAFGIESLDYDLDGHRDVIIGNGHINETVDSQPGNVTYKERQQLLHNKGNGQFEDDRASAGDLNIPRVTRGVAVGDYDNDGHPDILVSGPNELLALYHNEIAPGRHWIGFRLEGKRSNRDGIGAELRAWTGRQLQIYVVRSGSSYCSHSDMRPLFGLGRAGKLDCLEVTWPSGERQRFQSLAVDRYYHVVEGESCTPDRRVANGREK